MNHRRQHRRSAGALWLLVLALVSVLAPAWADSYLCPMAKASQVRSCCAKTEAMPSVASPGQPQIQRACDCPKLSWSSDASDQVREMRSGTENLAVLDLPAIQPSRALLAVAPVRVRLFTARSTPPLWLRNQAILC